MVAFIPSPAPFRDFVIHRSKREPSPSEYRGTASCKIFSGYTLVNGQIVCDTAQVNSMLTGKTLTATEVISLPGCFTAVLQTEQRLLVFTDRFGFQLIYYYEDNNHLIISNRLHAIALAMKLHRIKRQPNYGYIANTLYSDNPWFWKTNAHETHIQGVRLLPLDEYLEITGNRAAFIKRQDLLKAFDDSPLSARQYKGLIADGAEEVIENVRAIAESNEFAERRMGLTGGRDSRIVYGAALRAGVLDRFGIETYVKEKKNELDLPVSLKLTSLFGGNYFDTDTRERFPKSIEFSLAAARSMQVGISQVFGSQIWGPLGTARRSVLVSGGGGEFYRSVYYDLYQYSKFYDAASPHKYIENLYRNLVNVDHMPTAYRSEAFRVYQDSVSGLPGTDVRGRVDNHYMFFRSRVHYGIRDLCAFIDCLMWTPLESLQLLRAARSLTFDELARSKCEFDILDAIAPALNFVEYDHGRKWPNDMLRQSALAHLSPQITALVDNVDTSKKRADWEAARMRLAEQASVQWRNQNGHSTWADYNKEIQRVAYECGDVIRQSDRGLGALVTADHISRISVAFNDNRRDWLWYATKLIEIHDLCLDNDTRALVGESLPNDERYISDSLDVVALI